MNAAVPGSPSSRPNSSNIVSFPQSTALGTDPFDHSREMSCRDLPAGFLVKNDGIYELRSTEDGDTWVHLCSPLFVRGLCSRPDGSGWGRVIEIMDPVGRLHQHVIDEAHFAGRPQAVLRPLFNLGLVLERVDKADRSVVELLRAWLLDVTQN